MPPSRRTKKQKALPAASAKTSESASAGSKRKAATDGTAAAVKASRQVTTTLAPEPVIDLMSVTFDGNVESFNETAFTKFPGYDDLKKKARVKNTDKQNVARLFINISPQAVFEEQVRNTQLCRSLFEFLTDYRGATDTRIKREWKATITAAVLASLYALDQQNQLVVRTKPAGSIKRSPSDAKAFESLASLLQTSTTPPTYDWKALLPTTAGVGSVPSLAVYASPPPPSSAQKPCCEKNRLYQNRIKNGERPKGRPPHSDDCKAFVQQKIQALLKI